MDINLTDLPNKEQSTIGFTFNHTMLRVKDIKKSLDFYCTVLGFTLVEVRKFSQARFDLYFLALVDDPSSIPQSPDLRRQWCKSNSGILELTYNYDTELQQDFTYHNGNSEPRGFGHICISVPDLHIACARFEQLGVKFQKRINDGNMKYIAFIRDPDDYWVEIIQKTQLENEPN